MGCGGGAEGMAVVAMREYQKKKERVSKGCKVRLGDVMMAQADKAWGKGFGIWPKQQECQISTLLSICSFCPLLCLKHSYF